jgi:hypothetical protein
MKSGCSILLMAVIVACSSGHSGNTSVNQSAASDPNVFYVSNAGLDSNPGTLASPWKTIGYAASVLTAGQTAYVRAGIYYESVSIANSGSELLGPVTIQSYPGESPIVDGTSVACCGSSIKGLFNITNNNSYVVIDGFDIRNFTSNDINDEPAGILIEGSGSHIEIRNNKVHSITTTAGINGNAHGIGVYGNTTTPLSNITLDGNEVYDLKTGWSESVTIDGNVSTFFVTNNVVHDNDNIGIDMAGFWGMGPPGFDQANNGMVVGNTVYNISSINNPSYAGSYGADGIYCDGCTNVIIERNLGYANDINIEAASENAGQVSSYVIIRNNVVSNPNLVDITIGGYASNVGGSDHITVVNNSMYNSMSNIGNDFQIQYYATNNIFENNIVYANNTGYGYLYSFTTTEPMPAVMDYNLYFSPLGSATSSWLWNNVTYTGFAAYQAGIGQETHSVFADPLLSSIPTLDLQPLAGSPALNSGIDLGSAIVGMYNFAGNPRVTGSSINIGAY